MEGLCQSSQCTCSSGTNPMWLWQHHCSCFGRIRDTVTSNVNRMKCLLYKLDLIQILSREEGSQHFREHFQTWQSKLVAWRLVGKSKLMDLCCGSCGGICGNLELWENESHVVGGSTEDAFDWQDKESGKWVGSRYIWNTNASVSLCFVAQTLRPSKSHVNEVVNEF